jgi:UDP-N-acetylmuramoyl-tripeptide--D-alanyl-D-alanine ligase
MPAVGGPPHKRCAIRSLRWARSRSHWRAKFDIPLAIVGRQQRQDDRQGNDASILRAHYGAEGVLATEGNLNNAIGLPLTLLRLSDPHACSGHRARDEPSRRDTRARAIAQPTIAVVNNAQREHQEFMTSVDDVAAEHADAVLALRAAAWPC